MRVLLVLVPLLLLAGCRTTRVYEPPEVPPDATTVLLHDDEIPRVLYASAWGAFAEFGWEVVSHDSDALLLRVRPDGTAAVLEVRAVEDEPGGSVGPGRLVAQVEGDEADRRRVLEEAVVALASLPGRFTFR